MRYAQTLVSQIKRKIKLFNAGKPIPSGVLPSTSNAESGTSGEGHSKRKLRYSPSGNSPPLKEQHVEDTLTSDSENESAPQSQGGEMVQEGGANGLLL